MPNRQPCPDCEAYGQEGHNFCRMCRRKLIPPGQARWARLAIAYNLAEKFCGYCGGPKYKCECQSPHAASEHANQPH